MGITSILGFISLAGFLMLLAGAGIAISNASQNRPSQPGIVLGLVGLVIGVLFGIASSGIVEVGPSQVAVVYQRVGGNSTNALWDKPLGPGVHVILPIVNEAVLYSTQARTYTMSKASNEGQVGGDDSVQARTSDGQQVYVDVSVLYSIDPAEVNKLHVLWQNRYETDFVRPTVRSIVRQVFAKYSVNNIYSDKVDVPSKLPEIQKEILDGLVTDFTANGLVLRDFLLRETTFSDEFIKAVEAKQVAQQQAEQAKQEAERNRIIAQGQADAAVTAADGEAKANVARAKGEAEAITLKAEADAKALNLIGKELIGNPLLIQWRYIEKLASTVRTIILPSSSPYLFDANSLVGGGSSTAPSTAPVTPPSSN